MMEGGAVGLGGPSSQLGGSGKQGVEGWRCMIGPGEAGTTRGRAGLLTLESGRLGRPSLVRVSELAIATSPPPSGL